MVLNKTIYKEIPGMELLLLTGSIKPMHLKWHTPVAFPQDMGQILISLLLGDKLNSPGLEFGLEGGPQFAFAHKSWVEFNVDNDDKNARIRDHNLEKINRFDVGIVGGIGYRLLKGAGATIGYLG